VRKRTLLILFFTLIGVSVSGCIDEINFDIEREGGKLVVSGGIYDHNGPFTVELALTNDSVTVPLPLSGANVTLIDENEHSVPYAETDPGIYSIPIGMVNGQRGDTYHIEIELADGRVYRSLPEMIPLLNGVPETILEVGFIQESSTNGRLLDVPAVSILANTELPEHTEPLFLKWDVESVYAFRENEPATAAGPPANTCYITRKTDTQTINLIRTDELSSNVIENQPLVTKTIIRDQFYIRHVFGVTVSSVSERRYLYWQNVDEIINQSGTIFDAPPATVRGNIINVEDENDFALGYFEAAAKNNAYDFVTRADLPVFIPNPCPGPFECNDCLLIEDSSLERPDFF